MSDPMKDGTGDMNSSTVSAFVTSLTMAAVIAVSGAAPASAQVDMSCIARTDMIPLEGRASPLDSVMFRVAGREVKICYGRPSARGRTMIGTGSGEGPARMGEVPFGKIWRTGANEPTLLRTPIALSVAGVPVPAGTYAIYTVPGPTEWEIIVNRSYSQWGVENLYTDEVEAQEIGRGRVSSEPTDSHIETFTIRAEDVSDGRLRVIFEWERTRVPVPVAAGRG
jgi:Protein of unknown function (DUF2911)